MKSRDPGDTIQTGHINGAGIAVGAGAVATVINVHCGGVIPTLDLHALRQQLAARGAPPDALKVVSKALAGLPETEAAYRQMLRQAYSAWHERDLFVDLDLHADEDRRKGERPAAPWVRPEFCPVEHVGQGAVQRVKLGNLAEALDRYSTIALLGEPGAGKTTAMQHLAGELAGDAGGRLPLLVDLARYRHDDVLSFIAEAWPATLALALDDDLLATRTITDGLLIHLEGLLKTGRLAVLFDALNEMPRHAGYARRRENLRAFVDHWQRAGNRFAVSCRVLDYSGGELAGLQQVEIERLPEERVGLALIAYLPDKGPELWTQLQRPQHESLLDLVRTPYFLAMLANIYREPDTPPVLPAGRADLLRQFTDTLFRREEKKGYLDWIEAPAQRVALGELAYKMQMEGQDGASSTAVPLARARACLPNLVTARGRQWDVAPDVLLRLAAAASLVQIGLDERGNRRNARFWHQLLQEYFAAGELERRFADGEDLAGLWRWPFWLESEMPAWEPPSFLQPLPPPPGSGWEETTVLMAGLSGDPSRLVEAIVQANPALAGRCLAESGATVDEALRTRVQNALLATMRDVEVALRVRIAAGNVLGELGDPRFQGPYLLPEFMTVPAGEFWMGGEEPTKGGSLKRIYVPEFQIARYPVTNGQYAVFVAATEAKPPKDWQGNRPPLGRGSHPVVHVRWHDAVAYCDWLTAELRRAGQLPEGWVVRLPTEAEWEKAARGGLEIPDTPIVVPVGATGRSSLHKNPNPLREWPWGNKWDETRCNTGESGIRDTTAVGIYPLGASSYGLEEMAGNVWEWTAFLSEREGWDQVVRGGSWLDDQRFACCAYRYGYFPVSYHGDLGFRVVVSLALSASQGSMQ